MFDGTKPNQKIIFNTRFMLWKQQTTFETLRILAQHKSDTRRQVAENLIKYIKDDGGSVVVYNKSFEVTRIKELADDFPDLKCFT